MSGTTLPQSGERSVSALPGGAKPIAGVGWVGGVYPSAPLTARTADSDGHTASTRAARSAGLRFAVIVLSKTVDVGRDHLIHRKRSPFPYGGKALTRLKMGGCSHVRQRGNASLAAISEVSRPTLEVKPQYRARFCPSP